jgi:hypothetical protein
MTIPSAMIRFIKLDSVIICNGYSFMILSPESRLLKQVLQHEDEVSIKAEQGLLAYFVSCPLISWIILSWVKFWVRFSSRLKYIQINIKYIGYNGCLLRTRLWFFCSVKERILLSRLSASEEDCTMWWVSWLISLLGTVCLTVLNLMCACIFHWWKLQVGQASWSKDIFKHHFNCFCLKNSDAYSKLFIFPAVVWSLPPPSCVSYSRPCGETPLLQHRIQLTSSSHRLALWGVKCDSDDVPARGCASHMQSRTWGMVASFVISSPHRVIMTTD